MYETFGKRLLQATNGCNLEMHEPDEQGISVIFMGNHLDNACGDDPNTNCNEFTVAIVKDGKPLDWFNLATLIAYARMGVSVAENHVTIVIN